MKQLVPIACLLLAGFASADELLRFSDVFPIPGDNIEPFIIPDPVYGDETLHVGKRVLLSDADVADIAPAVGPEAEEMRAVSIRFNEEGAEKFARVTKQLVGGRLAMIVKGKLIQAPVIREPILGGSATISGLDEPTARELYNSIQTKTGKPPWPKDKPFWKNTPPPEKPETVPITEEEYREIKARRMKMGIHYLDSLPSEEELAKSLKVGLSYEEVRKLYGKPTHREGGAQDPKTSATWIIAPERSEPNPELADIPVGFDVDFSKGSVAGWRQIRGQMSREEKLVGLEPSTLKVVLPEIDLSEGEPDWIAFVEAIQVPDPTQPVNKRDLTDLLAIILPMGHSLNGQEPGAAHISANCDFMKTLAHNFPEVEALRTQAKTGRVKVEKLLSVAHPYLSGEKPLTPKVPAPSE
jgi:hypothetical protein